MRTKYLVLNLVPGIRVCIDLPAAPVFAARVLPFTAFSTSMDRKILQYINIQQELGSITICSLVDQFSARAKD